MPAERPAERPGPARRDGLPLGRPLGIPVYLAPSWLAAGVLVTYSLAPYFAEKVSPRPVHYLAAGLTALLFAVSVLLHELAHAVLSLRLGLPVRKITLYLFGGVTEGESEPPDPAAEYLVAVAGPLTSVFLAGSCALVATTVHHGAVHVGAVYLALTNGVLGALNLLPGLPLDGGRVLRSVVWRLTGRRGAGTSAAVRGGQALAMLAAAGGLLLIGAGDQVGLFWVVVGAFLWVNASAIGRRSEVLARLDTIDLRGLVRPALQVEPGLPLSEALRRAVETGRRLLVVDSYGAPAGVISGTALDAVPVQRRPWVTVADVARPIEPGLVLDDALDGPHLLERMRATPATEYLVTGADGAVAGVLSAHDVARVLEGREAG
jgi:Zn-dependent protease/CBS domain-containing protein